MAFDTSEDVFCPMIKAQIKAGQCLDIHFELLGNGEMTNIMSLLKSHKLGLEEIQAHCNACEHQPFKGVGQKPDA